MFTIRVLLVCTHQVSAHICNAFSIHSCSGGLQESEWLINPILMFRRRWLDWVQLRIALVKYHRLVCSCRLFFVYFDVDLIWVLSHREDYWNYLHTIWSLRLILLDGRLVYFTWVHNLGCIDFVLDLLSFLRLPIDRVRSTYSPVFLRVLGRTGSRSLRIEIFVVSLFHMVCVVPLNRDWFQNW